jgi:predicted permease
MGFRFLRRLSYLWRQRQMDADLADELACHQEMKRQELESLGMLPDDAEATSRRFLGNATMAREDAREVWIWRWADDLWRDLTCGARSLRRDKAFSVIAIVTLSIGIASNVAIFSLVDTVLRQPLPVPGATELMELARVPGGTLSYPMYQAIRDRNAVFSGMLTISAGRYMASARVEDVNAGDVRLSPVSGDYFATLSVAPVLGRALTEEDFRAQNAVIAYTFWQRRLAADPAIVGKSLRLGDRLYTIIGVAPAGFSGIVIGQPVDVWVPLTWLNQQMLENRAAFVFRVMARRKSGLSDDQVRANIQFNLQQISTEMRFPRPIQVDVASGRGGLTQLRNRFLRPLIVLMTIIALLLVMAAVNVANLLMARAAARTREMSVRLALGATRARLIRQLLTESVLLGTCAAAAGLCVAPIVARLILTFLSSAVGGIDLTFTLDSRILVFAVVLTMGVVLGFGLVPALFGTSQPPSPLLRSGHVGFGHSVRAGASGRILLVGQVAISFVLIAAAVLFARSLHALTTLDTGFDAANVILLSVRPINDSRDHRQVYEPILDRLAQTPGVESVALTSENLFSGNSWTEAIDVPGFVPSAESGREATLLVISPGFFRTLKTAILRGHDFEVRDNERAPQVAIVNETAARYYFGDTDVVGRTFRIQQKAFPQPLTVAGVVRDTKYADLREEPRRIIYLSYLQVPSAIEAATILVRAERDPQAMIDLVWKAARGESPSLRLGNVTTQLELIERTTAQDRMLAYMSGVLGLIAAILVCIGLYGLTSYETSRRTADIGLRMALGAQRRQVVRLVVRSTMKATLAGTVLGLAIALGLARLLQSLLFGIGSTDPITFLSTTLLLLAVASFAAYMPARRASRMDPMVALRCE